MKCAKSGKRKSKRAGNREWRNLSIPTPLISCSSVLLLYCSIALLLAPVIVIHEPDNSLLLVWQRDHAASSAAMAEAWCRPQRLAAAMWRRFIEAVRHHDDGWIESEKTPFLGDDGRPLDFKEIPTPHHVTVWRGGIDLAARDDAYGALLIAQHARWLYTHFGQDTMEDQARAQTFTDELTASIDRTIRELSSGSDHEKSAVESKNLAAATTLLSFFDQWSLVLIGALPDFQSDHALSFGDVTANFSIERRGDDVLVEPWPFVDGPWQLTTVTTRLRQSTFADPNDLIEEVAAEPPCSLTWSIRPR